MLLDLFKKQIVMLNLLKQKAKYLPRRIASATTSALTAVTNKIPNVNSLVKKTDYDAKTLDIKSKYFTTADYNRFTNEKVDLKIKQKQIVSKSDISGFIDNSILNKRVATIATKLNAEQGKIQIGNTYHIYHISAWKSKGCLMKVLMLLLHLIIALLQR